MSAAALGSLVTARARAAQMPRAVVHVVPVLHSDVEQRQPALCGFAPRSGPWVLRPGWPDRDCPLCAERAAKLASHRPTGAPLTFTPGSLTVELT